MNKFLNKDWFCLLLISFFAFAVISPMIFVGIPDGGEDFRQHLQFAAAYSDAISSGEYLPVWALFDNYGFGSVGIRFYPPISSFSLGLLKILTGNWFDAIWVSFLFWMIAGCFGIFYWAKEWLVPKYAMIAAVLYVIVPYHLLQIYQMWLNAEFVAAAILPFCFLFITRICRQNQLLDVLLFAVFYSLLLLSHIPTTIIGSLSLAVYVLPLINWSRCKTTIVKLFLGFVASLSATAFYWVKVITELDWVKVSDLQYSTGDFDPQRNLFPLFFSAGQNYLGRGLWHFDISFILTSILFLFALIYLGTQIIKIDRQNRKSFFALLILGLFALFMMSLPSLFIWQSIPILQKIQFPWRWLSVLSIISVLTFAFAISLMNSHSKLIKKILTYEILMLIFFIMLFDVTQNIIQSAPLSRTTFETKLPELFGEPACFCWAPTWAKTEAFKRNEKVTAGLRRVNLTSWKSTEREFTIEKGEPTNVRVATFYYPYWRAQVNGQTVPVQKDDDGGILFSVESEESLVKLYFQEPKVLKITLIISMFTWLLFISLMISICGNKKSKTLG